jgi:asparagine synthase (glutamine-hydrolysing)
MCGICGVYQFDGAPVDSALVQRMSASLRHRGPDGSGLHVAGEIGLGHRRLSIIDVATGGQPMTNEDGTLHIIFNGEIYNFIELREELKQFGHVFKTRSDTEVVVHAYEQWGVECLGRFNGIFAFALWDDRQRQLFAARDHLGVKPLYYAALPDRLLFASEIKALLEDAGCPRGVDVRSLSELFTLRYVLSPNTLFQGVKKIPPAHYMLVRGRSMEIKRYWNWKPQLRESYDENELIERYQHLVEDAVRLQMRSDVPVGLWLSSGMDSGALLSIMREHTDKPVCTFTIGFEQGERSNETDDAREMARMFGAEHSDMIVGPRDYERYFERHLWDFEEPLANETAAAFYFVSLISSRKVKVALTGQGADEPWAGYHRYIGASLSQVYSKLPLWLTRGLVAPVIDRTVKHERLRRGSRSLFEPDMLRRFTSIYELYTPAMRERLFQPWIRDQLGTDSQEARDALRRLQSDVDGMDALTQMTYIDTRANLTDDLLMVADKASMANSVEARVPFLDHRIVEFIETLPPHLKLRHFKGKYLHKKAVRKWLPQGIIQRKKKGFDNPIDQWLRGTMQHYIGDCLLSKDAIVNRYFDARYIQEIVTKHQTDGHHFKRQIYLLIQFELWHRRFLGAS